VWSRSVRRCMWIRNGFDEALAAVLEEPSGETAPAAFDVGEAAPSSSTSTAPVVIVCHGFRNTKESALVVNLSRALLASNRAVVRFDFAGNGASEGTFGLGNYKHEVGR
jgi:predicted alpha/beta-fold hydrolase